MRADFLRLLGREVTADGDVFLADSDAARQRMEEDLRSRVPAELSHECPNRFQGLFHGTKAKHLHKFEEMKEKHALTSESAFIADISQNPDFRTRSSDMIPAITRSSCFVSMTQGKVLTPSEVDASLGYPGLSTGGPADVYQTLTLCDSAALSSTEKRSLSGNGMHLACAGAWELYVCSNTIRREVLAGFNPHDL